MTKTISAVLLILLGVARGIGGVLLAVNGPRTVESMLVSDTTAQFLGLGLVVVCVLTFVAAYGLMKTRSWAFNFSIVTLVLFVLDGALNGYLLFGRPGAGGTFVNIIVAVVIVSLIGLARKKGELTGNRI